MRTKLIILIGLLMTLQGCNGQKKDLAKLTFTEKENTFFGETPHEFDKNYSFIDMRYYNSYKTDSEEFLNFNGINLSDYKDEKGKFGTNNIRFEFTKKNSILCFYLLKLYTEKSIKKTLDVLNDKFGKAKYVNVINKGEKPDAYLWIDNNIIYLLTGASQGSADLMVFDLKNKELYNRQISGPFQYYYDYLEYLKENNKTEKEVSYYQFAKIKEEEGNDYYIENYVKP